MSARSGPCTHHHAISASARRPRAEYQDLALQVEVHLAAGAEPVEQVVRVILGQAQHVLLRALVEDELEGVGPGLARRAFGPAWLPSGDLADLDVSICDGGFHGTDLLSWSKGRWLRDLLLARCFPRCTS